MPRGHLIIVAAPSGTGKTSLMKALIVSAERLSVSVSYTTRAPRPAEENGVHYHFVDHATFDQKVQAADFLEHATVFGEQYGTDRQATERLLDKGQDVILEIDWQGAFQVKKQCPDALSFFILPPSKETLSERLAQRGQDSEAVVAKRLAEAGSELKQAPHFDYLFMNDDFDQTLAALHTTIQLHRQQRWLREEKLPDLLAAF